MEYEIRSWRTEERWVRLAAEFVRGGRPPGGPYYVSISDHPRHLRDEEAELTIGIYVEGEPSEEPTEPTYDARVRVPLTVWRRLLRDPWGPWWTDDCTPSDGDCGLCPIRSTCRVSDILDRR